MSLARAPLALVSLAASLAACGPLYSGSPSRLSHPAMKMPAPPPQAAYAEAVALKADCNRGSGAYIITGERALTVKPIALTRAMCPQGSLSDRFARDVGRATSYFVKDGDLYLELPVDSGTLRFKRQG